MKTFLFAAVSALSAGLIFLVQPMITKLLLPYLGGGPQVWNVAVMLFQILLLGGYAYSFALIRWCSWQRQFTIHAALYLLTLAMLASLHVTGLDADGASEQPIRWMLFTLASTVALPFFALATTAPLIQHWFSQSGQGEQNPYPLYSASNIGSVLALVLYPLWLEWQFPLLTQVRIWGWGIVVLILLLAYAARVAHKQGFRAPEVGAETAEPVTHKRRMMWVLLGFLPCSLMMGVTTHITTDVASVPLFWVVPLLLYLLSLIIAFAHKPVFLIRSVRRNVLLASFVMAYLAISRDASMEFYVCAQLAFFFMMAVACHAALVERKPAASQLGEFYLLMSLGGALGGVFNVLLAPVLFTSPLEYPLAMGFALIVLVWMHEKNVEQKDFNYVRRLLIPVVLSWLFGLELVHSHDRTVTQIQNWVVEHITHYSQQHILMLLLSTPLAIIMYVTRKRPRYQAMVLALVFLVPSFEDIKERNYIDSFRNFFGVYRIGISIGWNAYTITHNTTLHGVQSMNPEMRMAVTSYYKPVRQLYNALSLDAMARPVAMVGLGAGTTLCAVPEGAHVDVFEIDPDIVALSQEAKYFTYFRDCPPTKRAVVGDARIMLAKEPDGKYGLIVLDAYSSDSIPVHTITKEALDMYFAKLAPEGVVAFHVTNRHLNLKRVLATYAEHAGVFMAYGESSDEPGRLVFSSDWVILARERSVITSITRKEVTWHPLERVKHTKLWTDQYSNVLSILYRWEH